MGPHVSYAFDRDGVGDDDDGRVLGNVVEQVGGHDADAYALDDTMIFTACVWRATTLLPGLKHGTELVMAWKTLRSDNSLWWDAFTSYCGAAAGGRHVVPSTFQRSSCTNRDDSLKQNLF